MPFALKSKEGPHQGLWFSPALPERWSKEPPDHLGRGAYKDLPVASAVVSRLRGIKSYMNEVFDIVPVEVKDNVPEPAVQDRRHGDRRHGDRRDR